MKKFVHEKFKRLTKKLLIIGPDSFIPQSSPGTAHSPKFSIVWKKPPQAAWTSWQCTFLNRFQKIWNAQIHVEKTLSCMVFWWSCLFLKLHEFWATQVFSFPKRRASQCLTVLLQKGKKIVCIEYCFQQCFATKKGWEEKKWIGKKSSYLSSYL